MENAQQQKWIPEFCYEEDQEGLTSNIPFVPVPAGEQMPGFIFVFESRETGEVEPGPEGEELPVTEMTLHQYCDMQTLKEKLSPIEFDNVRFALGLEPLGMAAAKGKKITEKVRASLANK